MVESETLDEQRRVIEEMLAATRGVPMDQRKKIIVELARINAEHTEKMQELSKKITELEQKTNVLESLRKNKIAHLKKVTADIFEI